MRTVLNNPWVVGGLCVLAVLIVSDRWLDSTAESPAPRAVPKSTPVSLSPASATPAIEREPKAFEWPSVPARDPFQPPSAVSGMTTDRAEREKLGAKNGDRGSFLLQAILTQGSTRVAMIDRQFVEEGETIAGYRVARIQEKGVLLQGPHDRRWLRFRES